MPDVSNIPPAKVSRYNMAIDGVLTLVAAMPNVKEVALLGSAYYSSAHNDIDVGTLISCSLEDFEKQLLAAGWTGSGDYGPKDGAEWRSYVCGDINILAMTDASRLERYKLAMEVCKVLQLASRAQRILVCQVIRDGVTAETAWLQLSHET